MSVLNVFVCRLVKTQQTTLRWGEGNLLLCAPALLLFRGGKVHFYNMSTEQKKCVSYELVGGIVEMKLLKSCGCVVSQ